ncbi:MAG: DUF502 domain-containing protein [Bacteroidia bacterium]
MEEITKLLRFFARRFTSFFLKGLVLIVPITVTIYIVYEVFVFLDNLLPYEIPGMSILIIILATAFLGFVGTFLIQNPLKEVFEKALGRIPLIKIIYTSIRDLLSAFVGKEKRFTKPVLVKTNRDTEMYKLGFITQKDLSSLGISEGKSAVYLPHSYNFSGNLFIVSNDLITPVDGPAEEIMKFIVSGGITKIS